MRFNKKYLINFSIFLTLIFSSCNNIDLNSKNTIGLESENSTQELPWQNTSVSEAVEKVTPWVASITTESSQISKFYTVKGEGAGTGIVTKSNGYILTNAHVIENAKEINVHLPNQPTYKAKIVGIDKVSDLAVLKINAKNLEFASFTNSDKLKVGQWVLTVGNALALKGGPTVTIGIISGLNRTITTSIGQFHGLIQTDAAINEGNSGGPLINLRGEVVGINQATVRGAQGIGFAIESNVASKILESLIETGKVIRPFFGISGQDFTKAIANELRIKHYEGIIVTTTTSNGPASESGIQAGDVITKLNDIHTPDMNKFLDALWKFSPGDKISVEFYRNQTKNIVTLTLIERR